MPNLFKTKRTNLTWSNFGEWGEALATIRSRHISSLRHKQEFSHWKTLVRHADQIFSQEDIEGLAEIRKWLKSELHYVGLSGNQRGLLFNAISKRENSLGKALPDFQPKPPTLWANMWTREEAEKHIEEIGQRAYLDEYESQP